MLLFDESQQREEAENTTTIDSTTSSPTILMTTKSEPKNQASKSQNMPNLCNHFNRGNCKFGDRCKFIHDHRHRPGLTTKTSTATTLNTIRTPTVTYPTPNIHSWTPPGNYLARQVQTPYQPTTLLPSAQPTTPTPSPLAFTATPNHPAPQPPSTPHKQAHQTTLYAPPYAQPNPTNGILGPAPGMYPTQATSLPSAFSTMT